MREPGTAIKKYFCLEEEEEEEEEEKEEEEEEEEDEEEEDEQEQEEQNTRAYIPLTNEHFLADLQ